MLFKFKTLLAQTICLTYPSHFNAWLGIETCYVLNLYGRQNWWTIPDTSTWRVLINLNTRMRMVGPVKTKLA